ncbi:hypothetical protein SAMN05660748_3711, partial [Blastococcus aggregatus]
RIATGSKTSSLAGDARERSAVGDGAQLLPQMQDVCGLVILRLSSPHRGVGDCDWWVVELDRTERPGLAFGYVCLGDEMTADWG